MSRPQLLPIRHWLPVYTEDDQELGTLTLSGRQIAMLRRQGEIVQQGRPKPKGPLVSSRPDGRLTAWQMGLIVLRHAYREHRLDQPLLRCIAGAEYLHQLRGFEPKEQP